MKNIKFKTPPGLLPELFPINIFDRIPENHPARLVSEMVDQLDITEILKQYKPGGRSAYHPRTMIKILFYSYLSNIYSCRKIAKALKENITFMFISGDLTPDFRTINDFRGKILKDSIQDLFAQVVKLLVEKNCLSLEVQYIDGTKIEAKSNRYTFVWRKSVEKYREKLIAKITDILSDIEANILSDDQSISQEEIPEDVDLEGLKKKASEISANLQTPTKAQSRALKKLEKEHFPKLEEYDKKLEIMGDRNSYSKTDHDATFMRMKDDHLGNGQLKPAYNVQISTEDQFITQVSIHQNRNDMGTLNPHLQAFESAYGRQSSTIVTDAGYGSEENYEMLDNKGIAAYVKYPSFYKGQQKKAQDNPFLVQNLFYNLSQDFYVCPMGQKMHNAGTSQRVSSTGYVSTITYYKAQNCSSCPLRGQCHQSKENRRIEVNHRLDALRYQAKTLLESDQGIIHRKKRCVEVESVFGQIKSNNKFNRFTFIGIDKAELEFTLMALGHNFRKMIAKGMPISKITAKIMPKNTQNSIGFTLIIEFYRLVIDQSRNRAALRNFQRLHKMIA